MNRRTFLTGLAATAGALILPTTVAENAEAARSFFFDSRRQGMWERGPRWNVYVRGHTGWPWVDVEALSSSQRYRVDMAVRPEVVRQELLREMSALDGRPLTWTDVQFHVSGMAS